MARKPKILEDKSNESSESTESKTPENGESKTRALSVHGKPLGRKAVLENESKEDRFVRLMKARGLNAVKALRLVGNLSNRAQYGFNEVQVRLVMAQLHRALESVEADFQKAGKTKDKFEL